MTTKYGFPPNRQGESKYAALTDTENGITAAAGGTQSAATKLTCASNYVSTVASGNDSVALPKIVLTPGVFGSVGTIIFVGNGTVSTSMQVFGVTPDTINGSATGTGVAVAGGVNVWFVATGYTASTNVGTWLMTNSQAAAVAAITSGTITGVTIDNSVIGGGTPAAGSFTAVVATDITGSDSSLGVTGLASTQGGAVALVGGASSTSGNAGGAVTSAGGAGGLTGAGGAVSMTGHAGGATSGTGGAASVTAGAGTGVTTAGGAAAVLAGAGGVGTTTAAGGVGGAASITAGAGGAKTDTGHAAGGAGSAASVIGGVGGATASNGTDKGGAGGNAAITAGAGGAASAGTGGGGQGASVVITPGAGGTSAGGTAGVAGVIRQVGLVARKMTVTAMTTTNTITVAALRGGMITANQGAAGAATYTMPIGSVMAAALPTDFTTGDSFDFTVTNISTNASEDVTMAGDTNMTAVGNLFIPSNDATSSISFGTFRVLCTGAGTYSFYRIG